MRSLQQHALAEAAQRYEWQTGLLVKPGQKTLEVK